MSFYAIAGGNLTTGQTVKLAGDNLDWNSGTTDNWVYIDTSSGLTPSELKISANPVDLTAGVYNGTATFTDSRLASNNVTVNITTNVQAALKFQASRTLNFTAVKGQSNIPTQSIIFFGKDVNWEVQADEPWVTLSRTEGTGTENQDFGRLHIGVDISNLPAGEYTSKVTISDTDPNYDQSSEAVVNLTVEPRILKAMDTGIALASMPTLSKLSSKINISENAGESVPWAATSSAAWLSVTPSGQTGSDLTMTASPTGLATDTLHMATVTITSSNPDIADSEILKVSFWVGATDPNAVDTVNLNFKEIITDPIRPYIYTNNNNSQIGVYNVHNTSLVSTISLTTVGQAGDMAITDNGEYLYVFDRTNYKVVEINLANYSEGRSWDTSTSADRITFGRVDAHPILFVNDGKAINIETGSISDGAFGFDADGNIDVSQNGEKLCKINTGLSPYSLACYTLDYSKLKNELSVNYIGNVYHGAGSNGADVALTHDGSRVYSASGAPYAFWGFDTATMQKDQELPGNAYPNNVEIGSDGYLYGGINAPGAKDVWVYNQKWR